MGCDIHAMYEVKGEYGWINKGNPNIGRNYELFSVLADVRNDGNVPFISKPRGVPEDCCPEFRSWIDSWDCDAHSASFVTLQDLLGFDISQEIYDHRLITSKDPDGKIKSTCGWTNGKHFGPVGKRKLFGLWGSDTWEKLISDMETLKLIELLKKRNVSEYDVRIVFFFDN